MKILEDIEIVRGELRVNGKSVREIKDKGKIIRERRVGNDTSRKYGCVFDAGDVGVGSYYENISYERGAWNSKEIAVVIKRGDERYLIIVRRGREHSDRSIGAKVRYEIYKVSGCNPRDVFIDLIDPFESIIDQLSECCELEKIFERPPRDE